MPELGLRITMLDDHIGRRIHGRRLQLSLSRSAFGAKIGVTGQQIQKYEAGASRVPVGHLFLMADMLGVHVGYFFRV